MQAVFQTVILCYCWYVWVLCDPFAVVLLFPGVRFGFTSLAGRGGFAGK